MNDLENKIGNEILNNADYVDQIYACNEPLSRAGSFVIPTGLLAQSSLGDDGPLSTGEFLCAVISSAWLPPARLPFLPGSRFPSNIIVIKRQHQQQHARSNRRTTVILLRSSSIYPLTVTSSFFHLVVVYTWHVACLQSGHGQYPTVSRSADLPTRWLSLGSALLRNLFSICTHHYL
ncbi:hypothetical protein T07_6224 [Trichinella nelsoni]|uniref:Uncharacterized protein n=1 Tax=Trichinella nelsoni TaxID=6336 RepID=A0A0V0SGG1_9BILA|nr:hypothetical protein T07_6224 [Trichinella nelsoni]